MMKQIIILLIACLISYTLAAQNGTATFHKAYQNYNENVPLEKAYLHTDRTLYKPGETIWFRAYLTDGAHLSSKISPIIYAELLNPKGSVERKLTLIEKDGAIYGDFQIGNNAAGGIYKIRAHSNWMKNQGDNYFFEKEITIQGVVLPNLLMKLDFAKDAYGAGDEVTAELDVRNLDDTALSNQAFTATISLDGVKVEDVSTSTDSEGKANITFNLPKDLSTNDGLINVKLPYNSSIESISRSIPIVLNDIDLQFFAEGGDLIFGTENSVAFKALDEFGKAADISGQLLDDKGKEIASFESFHKGMGSFIFTPEKGVDYQIKITKPEGIKEVYALPKILENALGLRVLKQDKDKLYLSVFSPNKQNAYISGYIGGKLQQVMPISLEQGDNKINIPTTSMTVGILQLTLFDTKLQSQAERLVFVNKHRKIKVDISTDKEKYLPREDVTVKIEVKDEDGNGVPGDFSLAVVDDQIHTFADDKQDNILSYLLMSSELRGEVDEPNFYFDPKEEKADEAIDFVMMTHGWRRFQWRDVLEFDKKNISKFVSHKADELVARGILYVDSKPVPGARVWLEDHSQFAKTDKDGYFQFTNIPLPALVKTRHRGLKAQATIYQYTTGKSQIINNRKRFKKDNIAIALKGKAPGIQLEEFNEDVAMVEVENEEVDMDGLMDDMDGDMMAMADQKELLNKGRLAKKEKKKMAKNMPARAIAMEDKIQMLDEVVVAGEAIRDVNVNAAVAGVAVREIAAPNAAGYFFATEPGFNIPNLYIAPQGGGTNIAFHNAKQFYSPRYNANSRKNANGTDQRKTLHWIPNIKTNDKGEYQFTYSNSDEVSTFRIIMEGISNIGQIIRHESTYFTQKAISMDGKMPIAVTHGDTLLIPVTVTNNSDEALSGNFMTTNAMGFILLDHKSNTPINIPSGKSHTEYYKMMVDKNVKGKQSVSFTFQSDKGNEIINYNIDINPKGFPRKAAFSSKELQRTFTFNIDDAMDGSLEGEIGIYPNIMEELFSGSESILREPYGCFEQTSSSNYPNIMALQYMESKGDVKPEIEARAKALLQKGYARLVGYECTGGGFEWFGNDPAHETLTAYGLVQFTDMAKVFKGVDKTMVNRTAQWLMDKRDGKGGFKQRGGGLDQFRGSSYHVGNAYIVYALSESGYTDISKEVDFATKKALKSEDAYQLALTALANFNLNNNTEAYQCLKAINDKLDFNGDQLVVNETVTRSYGTNRLTETAGLFAQGLMRSESNKVDNVLLEKVIMYLSSKRGHGGFGSTQATVLALKAMVDYADFMGTTDSSGKVQVYANGEKVYDFQYKKGHKGKLSVDLKPYLKSGKNTISVAFDETEKALPYSANLSWTSLTPASSKDCRVELKTTLASKQVKVGETVRLTAEIKNLHTDGIPTPIALIGIPAGLSLQPWQLKEMTDKKVFDYYEIQGNYLIAYFTSIEKAENKVINLDLKADIPGSYKAPASSAYLYYDKQDKDWNAGTFIVIND
ncbi:MAG: hypothetical protein ACI94Y_000707 [Maribacter sp.]|jgi:hypothetical protein